MSKTDPARDDNPKVSEHDEDTDEKPSSGGRPKEIGGRKGPDPTRYGDWEKGGRCIDF